MTTTAIQANPGFRSDTKLSRFAAGNTLGKANSGRPNALNRRIAAMRAQLVRAFDSDTLIRCTRKMVEMAENGDVAAYKAFTEALIGKPRQVDDSAGQSAPLNIDVRVMFGAQPYVRQVVSVQPAGPDDPTPAD